MKQQYIRTLQALFAHPLKHDLSMSDVEALMLHLEAQVEHLMDHRLKLQLKSGETLVLHTAQGNRHAFLDNDGVVRLRHFLKEAGITPEHPEPLQPRVRGDQCKRLVIHLDHRGARLWWLEGDSIESTTLQPHGLWSSHQHLTHRRDRDIAGQRAPLDYQYLRELSAAITTADRVLLLGHGQGESDIRHLLTKHIEQHHPTARQQIETASIDDTACSDAELLAIARKHFGNQKPRQ